MSAERWVPIPGMEDRYEASTLGRLRSLPRVNDYGRRIPGRVLNPGPTVYGYLRATPSTPEGMRAIFVHRLVAMAFLGPPPDPGMEICHNDGNRQNNAPSNLRWGTRSDNVRDALAHGTHSQASKTHCAQGHPFDDVNTALRITKQGWRHRECRACAADSQRRRRRRQRGERLLGAAGAAIAGGAL